MGLQYIPIDEKHQLEPSNYYGYTKLFIERNLEWFSKLKILDLHHLDILMQQGMTAIVTLED